MDKELKNTPLVLTILDGWGIAPDWGGNAISLAKTPTMHQLSRTMPSTHLEAAAEAVGLPHGIMGNSEVGHLNIGAGKIVKQFLPLIDEQIRNRTFFKNPILNSAFTKAKKDNSTVHLIGILSDGSVHGHINHLYALLQLAQLLEVPSIAIHAFTDGRDTEPTGALSFVEKLNRYLKSLHSPAYIATLSGRFFGMDRDNRWERTAKVYQAICSAKGKESKSAVDAITQAYKTGMIDEFIVPTVIHNQEHPYAGIKNGDVVIFYNFRADRIRQLAKAICGIGTPMTGVQRVPKVSVVTFTQYQNDLPAEVAFHPDIVEKSLSAVIADRGIRQFHVAETEKYAHVTYFFNGGIESPQRLETRLLIPSPKVQTYDQKPEMSAAQIADAVVAKLQSPSIGFYVVNFANADMVGHTGNIRATIKAVETIDSCVQKIWKAVQAAGGTLVITADHGNAEEMVNPETGLPDTEHTNNPVPFIIASSNEGVQTLHLKSNGYLGNVAPTLLDILGIEKPANMKEESLIIKS